MSKEKTEACDRFRKKTDDHCGNNQKAFSEFDDSTDLESIASVISRVTRTGKTIRCYRCFVCNRHFAAARMASALVLCRECFKSTRAKGHRARVNMIDRVTNSFRIFLSGRLEVR